MAKWPESNGKGIRSGELPATLSSLHPADFPLGSLESRAAARAMIRPGELRAGDRGTVENGGSYIVVSTKRDREGELVITFPMNMSSFMPDADEKTKKLNREQDERLESWLAAHLPA